MNIWLDKPLSQDGECTTLSTFLSSLIQCRMSQMTIRRELPRLKCFPGIVLIMALYHLHSQAVWGASCDEVSHAFGRWELVNILRRGKFSGGLDEFVDFKRVGNIPLADTCFTLILYSREAASGPGTNVHGVKRLLVFREHEYLGMYSVDGPPVRIRGNIVVFAGPLNTRDSIEFSKNGPPAEALIQGEPRMFFK